MTTPAIRAIIEKASTAAVTKALAARSLVAKSQASQPVDIAKAKTAELATESKTATPERRAAIAEEISRINLTRLYTKPGDKGPATAAELGIRRP